MYYTATLLAPTYSLMHNTVELSSEKILHKNEVYDINPLIYFASNSSRQS